MKRVRNGDKIVISKLLGAQYSASNVFEKNPETRSSMVGIPALKQQQMRHAVRATTKNSKKFSIACIERDFQSNSAERKGHNRREDVVLHGALLVLCVRTNALFAFDATFEIIILNTSVCCIK